MKAAIGLLTSLSCCILPGLSQADIIPIDVNNARGTCASSSNIFEATLCEQVYKDGLGSYDTRFTLENDEAVFFTHEGFAKGLLDGGCSSQLRANGGYASIKLNRGSSLSLFSADVLESHMVALDFDARLYVKQKFKERDGTNRLWGGCHYTNWDDFYAEVSIPNIRGNMVTIVYPNEEIGFDTDTAEYVVRLNPTLSMIGSLEPVALNFKVRGRDRNLFQALILDVLDFTYVPELFINVAFFNDWDRYFEVLGGPIFPLEDGKWYDYYGISLYQEVGNILFDLAEDYVNQRIADSDYLFKDQEERWEQELNNRIGNADRLGVEYRYSVSDINGKAYAKILPAIQLSMM